MGIPIKIVLYKKKKTPFKVQRTVSREKYLSYLVSSRKEKHLDPWLPCRTLLFSKTVLKSPKYSNIEKTASIILILHSQYLWNFDTTVTSPRNFQKNLNLWIRGQDGLVNVKRYTVPVRIAHYRTATMQTSNTRARLILPLVIYFMRT